MDSSVLTPWTGPFSAEWVSSQSLLLSGFKEMPVFNANSVYPYQTLRSAASDLGSHCHCPCYWKLGINGFRDIHVQGGSLQEATSLADIDLYCVDKHRDHFSYGVSHFITCMFL